MIAPWRSRRRDLELDEELLGHMRMAIEDGIARGERREDVERAVRREFGNLGVVKEVTREMWGGGWLERLAQDVRYGLRTLRRSPAVPCANFPWRCATCCLIPRRPPLTTGWPSSFGPLPDRRMRSSCSPAKRCRNSLPPNATS